MKIFDKADWQTENGVAEEKAVLHFKNVFTWLGSQSYLSAEGLEMLDIGIDSSISLNEKMLTPEGADFINQYYDQMLRELQYGDGAEINYLEKCHEAFIESKNNYKR